MNVQCILKLKIPFFHNIANCFLTGSDFNKILPDFFEWIKASRTNQGTYSTTYSFSNAGFNSTDSVYRVNENITNFNKDLEDKDKPLNKQSKTLPPVQSYNPRKHDNFENAEGWNPAFNDLSGLIKIKHYSPKTLKTYTN